MQNGVFVISLDFELMWGVRDKKTVETYGNEVKSVHEIIPKMLSLFKKNNIKATFATVGFLFANSKDEILQALPKKEPEYLNKNLSPYEELNSKIENFDDPYFWCSNLIDLIISNYPEQELATHTFSHYYCLEPGQTVDQFEEDLKAAIKIATSKGITLKSIVFPRNQVADEYLEICKQYGITSYRGVEKAWYYKASSGEGETKLKRAYRLLDAYVNLSGANTYLPKYKNGIINLPASRFLRPFNSNLSFLEKMKLSRIKKDIRKAAKRKEVYHLWWHPHNFGSHQSEMFQQLEEILFEVEKCRNQYGLESLTMSDVANRISNK